MNANFKTLPGDILNALKRTSRVKFTPGRYGDAAVSDLTESAQGKDLYMDWLSESGEINSGVYPIFGNPVTPWVNVNCQLEVHGLLYSFKSLREADFAPGVALPPFNTGPGFPSGGCYVYDQSLIALHMVISEIHSPARYALSCPWLVGVPVGDLVCTLTIIYANCIVVMSVTRQ